MIASSHTTVPVAKDRIDACLLGLLPWLASRFDLSTGVFRGEGDEAAAPAALLTARGRAALHALGLHPFLPHVVRIKLDRWPPVGESDLDGAARASPLARAARSALSGTAESFRAALRPYVSPDSGYALSPDARAPGSLAAAHHLLAVVRPRWFALRSMPAPALSDADIAALNERLLAAHAP